MSNPGTGESDFLFAATLPDWVPTAARHYLDHTVTGASLRQVARRSGCHASTVLRQVRKIENHRDDPLVDAAIADLSRVRTVFPSPIQKEKQSMNQTDAVKLPVCQSEIEREARHILRRLCETAAFLVVGKSMNKAVVMRETVNGSPTRTAVVDRRVAQAFAVKDWIAVFRTGKITSYEITSAGRAALKRLLAADHQQKSQGFAEGSAPFQDQHREWGSRQINDPSGGVTRVRFNLAESPVTALGRKKDKDGRFFLTPEMMQAADRLREDFELAQMGPRVTQNWDRFLTVGSSGSQPDGHLAEGPAAARGRVARAVRDLGPGLGDIALRCCCYLEGLETAEKRMGWSARSGKIVLRIALQRLRLHYDRLSGGTEPMIG